MRTLISNIGTVVTGDIEAPIADADSILVEDGRITAVGRGIEAGDGATVIDAKGTTAFPGLIDSHAHPVFGDFTPRQQTTSFIESGLHGGVTTVISAGYYLYVVMLMFMRPRDETLPVPERMGGLTTVVLAVTVVAILILGVAPEGAVRLARRGVPNLGADSTAVVAPAAAVAPPDSSRRIADTRAAERSR